jgi:hypothetical protein
VAQIRLLDARFLIALARRGGRLQRRKDLPERAFLPLSRLRRLRAGAAGGFCLRVAAVAMVWRTAEHPDPEGATLRQLARFLDLMTKDRHHGAGGTYGVFIDVCSLTRFGVCAPPPSPLEAELLLTRALPAWSPFFAHPHTIVLQFSDMDATGHRKCNDGAPHATINTPTHPPTAAAAEADAHTDADTNDSARRGMRSSLTKMWESAMHLPARTQLAPPPSERGWCFAALASSMLVKEGSFVLDVRKYDALLHRDIVRATTACTAERMPPLSPQDFGAQLATLPFADASHAGIIEQSYAHAFDTLFVPTRALVFAGFGWGDGEVHTLCRALRAAATLPNLHTINLSFNDLTSAGLLTLAETLANGVHCPRLNQLALDGNTASAHAQHAVRHALRATARASLASNAQRERENEYAHSRRSPEVAAAQGRVASAMRVGVAVRDTVEGVPGSRRRTRRRRGDGRPSADALDRLWPDEY